MNCVLTARSAENGEGIQARIYVQPLPLSAAEGSEHVMEASSGVSVMQWPPVPPADGAVLPGFMSVVGAALRQAVSCDSALSTDPLISEASLAVLAGLYTACWRSEKELALLLNRWSDGKLAPLKRPNEPLWAHPYLPESPLEVDQHLGIRPSWPESEYGPDFLVLNDSPTFWRMYLALSDVEYTAEVSMEDIEAVVTLVMPPNPVATPPAA